MQGTGVPVISGSLRHSVRLASACSPSRCWRCSPRPLSGWVSGEAQANLSRPLWRGLPHSRRSPRTTQWRTTAPLWRAGRRRVGEGIQHQDHPPARVEQVLRCRGGSGDARRSRVSREGVVTYDATAGSPRADFLVQRHHDARLRRIFCFLVCRLKSGRNRF
jgi:hypothetical protein